MDPDLELMDDNDQDSNTSSSSSSLSTTSSPFSPSSSLGYTNDQNQEVPQLNDDVLAALLKYVSMLDRIRYRRINKQWKRVVDQFWEPELTLLFFAKASWLLNDNYQRYQMNSESIEMSTLNGVSRVLLMPRFERLTKLTIHTNQKQDLVLHEQLPIDLSLFWNLNSLEITGEMVAIQPLDRSLPSLLYLHYKPMTELLFAMFPNLRKLECYHFQCDRYSNSNLISLRLYTTNSHILSRLCVWAPNLQHFHASNINVVRAMTENLQHLRSLTIDVVHIQNLNLRTAELYEAFEENHIKLQFNVCVPHTGRVDSMLKIASCLEKAGISTILFRGHEVDLKQMSPYLTNDNIHMLKMTRLNLDHNQAELDQNVLPFMYHTNQLKVVLNDDNRSLFHHCLQTMPNILYLFVKGDFDQSIVKKIVTHCPKLERLRLISTKETIDFDLRFLVELPYLTHLHLGNMKLQNANCLVYVASYFRLFTNLRLEQYAMDTCPIVIADAMARRASKNSERFYEFDFYQVDNCESFIQNFKERFKEAPHNFHSDLFHV